MSKTGAILVIDDDAEDFEMIQSICKDLQLPNKLVWYGRTDEAYDFLSTTEMSIFLILADLKIHPRNGLEFKKQIDSNPVLRKKSIPFIFYANAAEQREINLAYIELSVQGFFIKGMEYSFAKQQLKNIFDYWRDCRHPNVQ